MYATSRLDLSGRLGRRISPPPWRVADFISRNNEKYRLRELKSSAFTPSPLNRHFDIKN